MAAKGPKQSPEEVSSTSLHPYPALTLLSFRDWPADEPGRDRRLVVVWQSYLRPVTDQPHNTPFLTAHSG